MKQRRLLNQRGHVAVEEREQKSTYVRAIDIRIGHGSSRGYSGAWYG